jgi:carbon monoxide dehydrogenase subunit G
MELTNEFRVRVPVDRAWEVLTDLERIAPCMPGAQLQEVEGDQYRGIVKVKVGPITANYKGQATFIERDEAAHRAVLRAEGRDTRGQGNANATITATLIADGDGTAVTVVTDLTVTGRVAQFGRGVLSDVSAKLLNQFVDCLESTVLVAEPAGAPLAAKEAGAAPVGSAPATEPADDQLDIADIEEAVPEDGEPLADTDPTHRVEEPPIEAVSADEAPIGTAHAHFPNGAEAPPVATPTIRRIDSPEPTAVNLLDTAGAPLAKRVAPIVAILVVLWMLRRLFGGD